MVDQRPLYVPWYEASPEGLDELALIKRTVDLSQDGPDGLSR